MNIKLKQIGSEAYFEGTTESGHTLRLNAPLKDDEEKVAPSPMEALLMAIAGCTCVDIVIIMKKMKQNLENLEVEVTGNRLAIKDAKPFRKIELTYIYRGQIDIKKADRATKLSVEKYCSVIETISKEVEISWKNVIEINSITL